MSQVVTYKFNDGRHVVELVGSLIEGFDDIEDFGQTTQIGFYVGEECIGGVVFNNYTGHDVCISIGAKSPLWATKKTFKMIAKVVFDCFHCTRATVVCSSGLARGRQLYEKLGFRVEGIKRRGFDGTHDAIIFGMLKEECPWYRESNGEE